MILGLSTVPLFFEGQVFLFDPGCQNVISNSHALLVDTKRSDEQQIQVVDSTHQKNTSQIGSFPKVGVKKTKIETMI